MVNQAAVRLLFTRSIALVLLAVVAGVSHAGTISMAWDPLNHPDLVGYRVFYGTSPGNYTQTLDVGVTPQATLPNLNNCTNYYVSVKGRASDDTLSSAFSNELQGWARPEVLVANPASVERASQLDLTINGANFMAGATVQFSDPAIVVNSVTVLGCTSLTVNISVPAGTALGSKSVTVVNPDQVLGTGSALLNVTNAAPDGAIDQPAGPVTISAGDTVQFAGSGSDPDGNLPLTYQWSFGSSLPGSTQQNPGAVQYDTPGTYQASLTVSDALGLADPTPATVTITVDQAQAPLITAISAGPVAATTASINWTTDKPATSQVLFRQVGDTVYQQTAVDTALVASHTVDLQGLRPETTYEFQVRSADSSGLTATEPAADPFTTQANGFSYLRIETESGPITPPAETVSDSSAFRGAFIRLSSGTPGGNANNPSGSWNFGFQLPAAGQWRFWYRMYGQNNNSNSWFERVDGASFQGISPPQNGNWFWVAGRSYNLSSGLHVVTLGGSEALARIDRILVTDDPTFVPTEAPGGDTTAPGPATAVVATAGDGSVDLSWTNPSEAGSFRVVVRYATGGSQPLHPFDGLPLADLAGVPGAAESLLHTGLVNGTTYRYSVFVIDASDNASPPATAAATPQPASTPLGTVQNLRRTDTAN